MTSTEKRQIKKLPVIAAFLFRLPNGDEKQAKVALFRCSGKVISYKHSLGPVYGSIEEIDASPFAAALRGINEETGLTLTSIEPIRVGKPFSFIDDSIGRELTVNPFAFRIKDKTEGGKGEEGISLDWENVGYEWVSPLDVKDSVEFGGVPILTKSLGRVWPECHLGSRAGGVLTSGLKRLQSDHENGARQLAHEAVSILMNLIAGMDSHVIDDIWWANIRMAAWHICKTRESMGAAITSAIMKALGRAEAMLVQDISPPEKARNMTEAIRAQLDQRWSTTDDVRSVFVEYLRQNVTQSMTAEKSVSVLTLSSSSTISTCLLQAAADLGISVDLRILESRPLCEGVTLASRFLGATNTSATFTVSLYTDASVALAAGGVDIVLLGADRISSAGDVSNKVGSLPAVLSQRHVAPSAKVIIISETEKIASPGLAEEHAAEENNPIEVTQAWKLNVKGASVIEGALDDGESGTTQGKVRVRNTYFEWVPAQFIDAYVTDEGLWSVEDISRRSSAIGDEMDKFFKEL
ncbi:nagb/rpia/CoA transferase-like protein [Hypoxylon sp. NC1633]|nr:nagb/rpia/CoA transferase-like protein [Hypoxylon sp. NC1633]